MDNTSFVEAVKKEQQKLGYTQAEFSKLIGVSQGALSKFYKRGVKNDVVIKVLARFPRLAVFFASKHSD